MQLSDQATANYMATLENELCSALGQAIWAFSKIEGLTYEYMKTLSSEPLRYDHGRSAI